MGGIYGGKDIRPISQKQDSLHGLINTILDKLPLGYDEYDMSMEDLIPETNTVITMTKLGYIKRMSTDYSKKLFFIGKNCL